MLTARAALGLLAAAALCPPAFADGLDDYKGKPLVTRGDPKKAWKVYVAAGDLEPRLDAGPDAKPVPNQAKLKFLEEAYIADERQVGPDMFVLLADANATKDKVLTPYGWVPDNLVLRDLQSLKVRRPAKDDPKKMETLEIRQKAVIVNKPEVLDKRAVVAVLADAKLDDLGTGPVSAAAKAALAAKGVNLSDAAEVQRHPRDDAARLIVDEGDGRFYRLEARADGTGVAITESLGMARVDDSPLASARPRAGFRLANTFFVYKRFPSEDAASHLLLGTKANVGGGEKEADVIRGWVPASRAMDWNTGEGFRWDDTRTDRKDKPGHTYKTLRGARTAAGDDILATEAVDIAYQPITPRFLLIDALKAQPDDRGNQLLKLAASGTVEGKAVSFQPSQNSDARKKDLEQIELGFKNLDLVFVIDDSVSMLKSFKPIGEVVDEMLSNVLGDRQLENPTTRTVTRAGSIAQLRVAVTYFSDAPAEKPVRPGDLTDIFAPATSDADARLAITKLADEMKAHKFYDGGDLPEQLYEGVYQAVDHAKERLYGGPLSKYHRRVMVIVSDAASKPLDVRGRPLTDAQSRAKLLAKLAPGDAAPFEVYAVRVEEPTVDPKKRHQVAIELGTQMRAFCKEYNDAELARLKKLGYTGTPVARFFPDDDAKLVDIPSLSAALKERFAAVAKQQKEDARQIRDLRMGVWPSNPSKLNPAVVAALATGDIKADQFAALDAFEIYSEAYSWRQTPDGKGQLRSEFLLNEGELVELLAPLKGFVGLSADQLENPKELQKVYVALFEKFVREGETAKTFGEAFASRYGIATGTKFLLLPYDQLTTGVRASSKDMAEFRVKVNRLDDLLKGVNREWKVVPKPNADAEFVVEGPADEGKYRDKTPRYFTQPGSGTKYFWVSVEDLP